MKTIQTFVLLSLLTTPGCASKRPFILHTAPIEGHEPMLDDYARDEELDDIIEDIKDDLLLSQPDDAKVFEADMSDVALAESEEQYEEFTEEQYYERPLVEVKS